MAEKPKASTGKPEDKTTKRTDKPAAKPASTTAAKPIPKKPVK